MALLLPLQLFGAEQSVPLIQEAPPPAHIPDQFEPLEAPRNYLSEKITRFANEIDRFFGGDRHYQESNQSVIQLNITRADGFGGDHKFNLGARLNLKLPRTEGRLRLLLETDPEQNATTGQPTVQAQTNTVLNNKVTTPKSAGVAVRLVSAEDSVWNFHADGGLKFPLPIKPFARARGSFSTPLGEWQLKAAESVYWFNTLGVGETTQLDLERIYSTSVLFRASSNATWLKDKNNFDLRQDLTVYHTLDDRTSLQYQLSAIGVSNPQLQATDFVAQMSYRYRLHREWLFFELRPQLHFPKANDYRSSPALNMLLEILFDESR